MVVINRKDPDWKIKVDIAKTVAEQPQPSLMKFYQAFSEEFGTQPPEELIDYFNELLGEAEKGEISDEDEREAFIREASEQSLSVLKFRQAYSSRFQEKPSTECIERYIEGLSGPDPSANLGPVNLAKVVIDQLGSSKKMTVLEFRKAFKQKLGKLPSAEHVQLFIDRLSQEASLTEDAESVEKTTPTRPVVASVGPPSSAGFSVLDGITNSAILLSDTHGTIIECNRAAESLLEVDRVRLVNKSNILSLVNSKDLEIYFSQLSLEVASLTAGFDGLVAKVDSTAPFTKEWRFQTGGDRTLTAEMTITRYPATGPQQGYLFEICDRTEYNDMRRRIQDLLEQRQGQRIERENLIAAIGRKVLDPVTSIKGFSELLSEKSNQKLRRYFDLISGSADAIVHIIADYLISHNVIEGDFELEASPFCLQTLAADAVRYHARWLGTKDVIIELVENETLSALYLGDGVAIRHVLTAILSHAIDLPGGHHIQVQPSHKTVDGNRLQIILDVVSRGSGILPEQLQSVFSSSENLAADNSMSHVMTELSLGICKQLARMMGGDIELKAISDNTVCYRFTALVDEEVSHQDKKTQQMRILVGENDPAVYRLLNKILTDEGCQVTWAKSGQQVVDQFLGAPSDYDLILMDIGMPEKNGMIATKELRAAGHTSVPILALTACNVPGDSERFLMAGMSGYIIKPFNKQILINSLIKWQSGGNTA